MSSDRPGRPADVVPEGEDPQATGSTADTGPIRPVAGRRAQLDSLRELRGKAAKIKEKRETVTR